MSEMLFYSKPVALNREEHKTLRFKPVEGFSFSKEVNSVPITGQEFFEASRDMTVLFGKSEDGHYFPMVMMSLRNSGHDLVDEDGKWAGSYVPAFIRRYPFALTGEGTVCLDEESEAFSDSEGDPLFNDEGENSEMLDRVITFLRQYDAEVKRTRVFCEALAEKDLLAPFDVEVGGQSGNGVRLKGLYALDAAKFADLRGDTLELWFSRGWIAWLYAHLHSIGALGKLPRDIVEPSDSKPEAEATH